LISSRHRSRRRLRPSLDKKRPPRRTPPGGETAPPGERPLCCGRTFLSVGLVAQARLEATRLLEGLAPLLGRGGLFVGPVLPRVGLHVETGVPMRAHMPTTDRHMATAIRKDDRWYSQTEALRQRR